MSTKGPIKGTRIAGNRYYWVRAEGVRRVWMPLTRVKEGLPAFYRALADAKDAPTVPDDAMPKLCADWQRDVMPRHAPKTQRDEVAMCKTIAVSFEAFRAPDVRPPDVADYLRPLTIKPRTHNGHRAMIRELMRYAEERGFREPGSNPVTALRTMPTPARRRYITDSELRRIKVAAMKATDRHGSEMDTRSGPMLCCLIDMAYLTGQAIGDLLDIRWKADADEPQAPHIREVGIWFARKKLRKTTREEVTIEWSPKLLDVVRRLKLLRLARPGASDWLFIQKRGEPYTYSGAYTAWKRARQRSGVKGCTFHDLRAKALTDKEEREGMQQARVMGSHSTEQQTADYVRPKKGKKTGATR